MAEMPLRARLRIMRPVNAHFALLVASHQVATGASSEVMACEALGLQSSYGAPQDNYPRDMSDWTRCLITYNAAPANLQRRMRPVMDAYADKLRALSAADGVRSAWRTQGRALAWPPEEKSTWLRSLAGTSRWRRSPSSAEQPSEAPSSSAS